MGKEKKIKLDNSYIYRTYRVHLKGGRRPIRRLIDEIRRHEFFDTDPNQPENIMDRRGTLTNSYSLKIGIYKYKFDKRRNIDVLCDDEDIEEREKILDQIITNAIKRNMDDYEE